MFDDEYTWKNAFVFSLLALIALFLLLTVFSGITLEFLLQPLIDEESVKVYRMNKEFKHVSKRIKRNI